MATVDQNKVVSTIRGSEVAADPTNALALEAANRRAGNPTESVRLAAIQRVVRAQRFDGPGYLVHFSLLGAVTAGRDTGNLAFERQHTPMLSSPTVDSPIGLKCCTVIARSEAYSGKPGALFSRGAD